MQCLILILFYQPCISNPIGFTWLTLVGPWSIGGYRFPSGARPGAGATEAVKIKIITIEPRHEKTGCLPIRTQRRSFAVTAREKDELLVSQSKAYILT